MTTGINPIAFNISLTSHELLSLSTELVELKIEEFLASFGEKLNSLTEEAFNTQVCVCVCVYSIVREKLKSYSKCCIIKEFPKCQKLLFKLLW